MSAPMRSLREFVKLFPGKKLKKHGGVRMT